jgi:hypothetical protein
MKVTILILIILIISGCDLVKPLPGKNSITIGKEGVGIDKLADKVMEKADKIEQGIETFKKTGELVKKSNIIISKQHIEEYVKLEDVADTSGSGEATRLYKDGQFTLRASAELPIPQDNYFYEGWLVRSDPLDFISAGKMTLETDGKYYLSFVVNNDYMDYNKVVITLEPDDDNFSPAAHIIEGEFK